MTSSRPGPLAPPRIDQRAVVDAWFEQLDPAQRSRIADCDDIPPRPPLPAGSDYLAATRSNDRGRTDHEWQHIRGDLGRLVARRLYLGLEDGDDDDRLVDWIWDYLTAGSWAVAAHVPGRELPTLGRPTIDLAACEMAMVMAELREQLLPWIERISPSLGDSIVAEIERRTFAPFEDPACADGWATAATVHNNWTGVCAGSLLAAACSLGRQGLPRPATTAKALGLLQVFLERGFTADGECDEGPGYWSYGLGFCCYGLMGLGPDERDAAIDRDRLTRVADYPRRAHLFGDVFYAANDAGDRMRPSRSWMPWLAAETGNPWLAGWSATRGVAGMGKALVPWRLAALDPPPTADWPGAGAALDLVDQQARAVATGPLLVTLGGGHNGECHNHNDVGHVNVYLDEAPLILDMGAPHYASDFFSEKRYDYLSANSRGHNVPEIGGHLQRTGGDAGATITADEPFTIEAAAAYPDAAGVASWSRSLAADGDAVVVTDAVAAAAGTAVTLRWWCSAQPAPGADSVAVGGLAVASDADAPWAVERIESAEHLLRLQDRFPTLWALSQSLSVPATGRLTVATRFAPG